jgi:hypothetical protein
MGSFGINRHAHVDAAVFSFLLTLSTYAVKWLFGMRFPDLVFGVPPFIAAFIVYYLILYVVFLVVWNRR